MNGRQHSWNKSWGLRVDIYDPAHTTTALTCTGKPQSRTCMGASKLNLHGCILFRSGYRISICSLNVDTFLVLKYRTENFKREDLARAWLQYYIIDLCASIHLLCLATGLRRVFFSGSFSNTELVRKMVTTEMAKRIFTSEIFGLGTVRNFYNDWPSYIYGHAIVFCWDDLLTVYLWSDCLPNVGISFIITKTTSLKSPLVGWPTPRFTPSNIPKFSILSS